jgi:hypothetical protein
MSRVRLSALVCFLASMQLLADRLDLSQGAMTAGGSAMVQYNSSDMFTWNLDYLKLGISTNWGFFFYKDVALVLDVKLLGQISAGFDQSRLYQFGTGVLYAFDLDSNLYPYVQLLGYGAYVTSGWSAGIMPSFGLMVGLSSQVALDFGFNSRLDFAISRDGGTALDMGMGYVGMRAFF